MKRLLTIMLALTLFCAGAFAQTTVKVQAPSLVGVNEQFNIKFVIEGENSPSDFNWDVSSDFQLVWGPQKGSSTSVSIINGKTTRSSQTTYTYVLLPKKTGKFTLAPAVATVKGNQIASSSHAIEVVTDGHSSSQGQQGGQSAGSSQQQRSSQGSDISSDDLYLRLILSKTSAMVGETITATLKLYQRVNIVGFEDARFPAFTGFWSQELQGSQTIDFTRESVGDKIYNTAVIRSWTIIPQQSGELKVDPAELVCLVNVRAPRASTGSIFDSFFQDDYQTIRKRVTTGPATIRVSGLPAGAPDSFKGGVGSYKMDVELSTDALKTHDAGSLKVLVTGRGNTTLLEAPKVNFPPDFEVYDTKVTDVSGGKLFEYPFIPRSHGSFTIDPVEYSYFDIDSRKYVTLRSEPLEIEVAKGTDNGTETSGQLVQGVNRKDVRDLGSDIRFISTKMPSLSPKGSFFAGSAIFWVLTALLAIIAAAVYAAFRGMAARRADVAGSKNRSATKMARKRLAQAGEYLSKNLYTAFYEELHKALLGFVSDKLNMDAADMSKENISERLKERGVSEGLAADFVGLIDACEFARYSPNAGHEAMNAHYESAVGVISSIDESMKHKKSGSGVAALLALLLLIPAGLRAADSQAESLWTAGSEAYASGQWAEARDAWSSIIASGVESPELYYNLGNACYKDGDIAHAILSYERALKLDPSYSDAKFNLEFVSNLTQDKIEQVPEFFLKTMTRKVCWLFSADGWAVMFLLMFAAALGLFLLFLLGNRPSLRKSGFFGSIAVFLLSVMCLSFALWQRADYGKADDAIVVKAVCSVKSSPGSDSAKDLFVLHEGTKVKILDEVGSWKNIELSDGRQGWLQSSDLEVI